MENYIFSFDEDKPKYKQIYEQLKALKIINEKQSAKSTFDLADCFSFLVCVTVY